MTLDLTCFRLMITITVPPTSAFRPRIASPPHSSRCAPSGARPISGAAATAKQARWNIINQVHLNYLTVTRTSREATCLPFVAERCASELPAIKTLQAQRARLQGDKL